MPKLAITLFYCEEQNEPSKPDNDLILLPDDETERDQMLIERYRSGFEHGEDENVTVTPTQEYGDLQVSSDTNDIHMFVTFVSNLLTPTMDMLSEVEECNLADELNAVGAEAGIENGVLYLTDGNGNPIEDTDTHHVMQTNAGPDLRTNGEDGFTLFAVTDVDDRVVTATYRQGRWS